MWEVISLNMGGDGGGRVTVRAAVERRVNHICQTASGGSYYAVITLRVEPYSGSEGVAFLNAAPSDAEFVRRYGETEVRSYVEAVAEGVCEGLRQRAEAGQPVTNLLVVLTELRTHDVDSKPSAYRRAGKMGLDACLEQNTLETVQETA